VSVNWLNQYILLENIKYNYLTKENVGVSEVLPIAASTVRSWTYRMGQKTGPQTHGHNSVKSEPITKKITGRLLGKFLAKWILKIPLHLAYVATLPCETLMSAKQAITITYKVV